jgi:hypothetical protein
VTPRRRFGAALGLAGLAVVLIATLTPTRDIHALASASSLLCLVCGDRGGADVANNLLLFLPLAMGLRLSGQSWPRTVLAGALLSFTVELLQLRIVPGRDASLSDLLTNTISSAIGATIGTFLPRLVAPSPRRALGLLVGGLLAVLALLAAWAWLLVPRAPTGKLTSLWANEAPPGMVVFGGTVRSVLLDGVPMPANGPAPDPPRLRHRLERDTMALDADIVSGAPTRDRLWVYTLLHRAPSGGALTLTQLHRGAGVELPTRALKLRLGSPLITLADAFPDSAGVPVHLRVTEASGRVRLTSSYSGVERSVELGLSPAFGWILFLPFEVGVGTGVRWATGLILGLLLLPVGFWAAWTRRPLVAAAALAAGLVAGLAVIPALFGLPPVHWTEWLAGALGAAAGWALQRPAAYLQGRCASPSDSEFSSS